MKTSFKGFLNGISAFTLMIASLYFAIALYNEGAYNIFMFFTWVMCIGAVVRASDDDLTEKKIQAYLDGDCLPSWIDIPLYLGIIITLAFQGWFWLAGAWIIISGTDFNIRDKARVKENESDN